MKSKTMSLWLPQVIFESALIVVSILVALGLDEWREDRQDDEVVRHALSNFFIEIQQNRTSVDDAAPFNQGLKNVLAGRYEGNDIGSVDEFVTMVESFVPAGLQSTAWETALATGALAKMDYTLVSALSLTYGLQNRYIEANRTGADELTSPQNVADGKLKLAVYNSIRYLENMTRMEVELREYYTLTLGLLAEELGEEVTDPAMPGEQYVERASDG
jgi:hypothetical protein